MIRELTPLGLAEVGRMLAEEVEQLAGIQSCVAELDADYIARMEDVLALYEKPCHFSRS